MASVAPAPDSSQRFPLTQWSLVARAGGATEDERREALGVLMRRYLPALRAHLVFQKRISPHLADDVVQGFVCDKVVEQGLLAGADQCKGRFRTFLLTALDRYVIDQARFEGAKKRAPGGGVASLEQLQMRDPMTPGGGPSVAFDVAWAREVLAEAVKRMEEECMASERPDTWGVFRCRVLEPTLTGAPQAGYGELVARFRLRSPAQASNVLMTAKRMFERVLRSVVGEYAEDEAQIDQEIEDLRSILSRAGN
jgi:RNA polymerase sigma-70 factor (ECF subfamily)